VASLPGCLVEGSGSKTFDAVASATMAGAATVIDEVGRERAARNAAFGHEHYDGCATWECFSAVDMTLEQARGYATAYINHARADEGVEPLTLDYALSTFAQMGSRQLARDHRPHQHIVDDPMACLSCAENQGSPDGIAPAPVRDQLDAVLGVMMSEGPGGPNHDVILGSRWHRLGIGVVNPNGPMYFTIDFAP
jgi:hypothetical protein